MKIAVLASGGVDSSVALHLLEEEDHDVTAFYLKIWLEDELTYLNSCPWEKDTEFVREVCKLCNAKLRVVAMQKAYHERVVQYAINEVQRGRTPNPDIFCNKLIKFGLFYDQFGDDFDCIASGHYAQIAEVDGKHVLKQAPDPVKDQTYFLSQLPASLLPKLMFPIGSYSKEQVRSLAHEFALPNRDRKDSQGICFLGQFKYKDFLKHYLGTKPGYFYEYGSGERLGEHEGFWFFTTGQRKGIGLSGGPWFVVCTNPDQNTVFLSRNYDKVYTNRNEFAVVDGNWFLGHPPEGKLLAKLRHGPDFHRCIVKRIGDNVLDVVLSKPDQGIANGQFAAFYSEDGICYGSGVMKTFTNPPILLES